MQTPSPKDPHMFLFSEREKSIFPEKYVYLRIAFDNLLLKIRTLFKNKLFLLNTYIFIYLFS